MTQERDESGGAGHGAKWAVYSVLFLVGIALAAFFLGPDLPRQMGRSVHKRWQEFVWDKWNKGVIQWGRYSLRVPVGQYGWIKHDDGDLAVFSRDSVGIVSILVKDSARARWPFLTYAERTCAEKKLCSRYERKVLLIGARNADLVVFEDAGSSVAVRSNAFIYLKDPETLLSIGAERHEDLERALRTSVELLEQIVRQSKE
jgi:hypothetical protein